MAVTFSLPTVLAKLADGQSTIQAGGGTLGDVVAEVAGRFPRLAPRLRDATGGPTPSSTYYLNDEDVRFRSGFATPVREGDEITVVAAIAGGSDRRGLGRETRTGASGKRGSKFPVRGRHSRRPPPPATGAPSHEGQ